MFVDTTFCIDLMREQRAETFGRAIRKLEELGETPLFVSMFVLCELHAGALMSGRPDGELEKVQKLMELVEVVYPQPSFPIAYGEAEAYLRQSGNPIATIDLLIGVMSQSLGLPILTRNVKHFERIPNLVVETY